MSYHPDDTICAIGTAGGGAARGMVRVSGPDAVAIVGRFFRADDGAALDGVRRPTALGGRLRLALECQSAWMNPPPARLDSARCGPPYQGGEKIVSCDLYLWPSDCSYTREPVAELHTIGSTPILQAVLVAVCRAGARLAEPGEFTLRAFLAGRVDLTQAEAVLGVIDASGAGELDSALAQLAGGLSRPLHQLRKDLLQLLAELEAGLDFVDEDIRFISQEEVTARLRAASELLAEVSHQMDSRHAAIGVPQVALVGAPNVGKSSLFNAMGKRFAVATTPSDRVQTPALVSPRSGTTRDYITARISLDGFLCELVDTAGVDSAAVAGGASIDAKAQTLAAERGKRAAIRALCVAATELDGAAQNECDLLIVTKVDLAANTERTSDVATSSVSMVATSSATGEGLDKLAAEIRAMLARDAEPRGGQVVATTANRCRESIHLAAGAVRIASDTAESSAGDELVAVELRVALDELGKVVGTVYTDDLLDRIFKTFCIGK